MTRRRDEQLAHVLWWGLHAVGFAAIYSLPSDLRLGEGLSLQHWIVALVLSANVLAHYAIRYSDPGWAPRCASLGEHHGHHDEALIGHAHGEAVVEDSCQPLPLGPQASPALSVHGVVPACGECGAVWRHPATVHCRFCDRCVEGFDHHCMWLGVCVGGRNHHLFARYVIIQAVVCALGFHYALTACGRRARGGRSWAYLVLLVMGLLTLVLGLLAATHVFMVLTRQTSRQVVNRLRARSSGRGGGTRGSGRTMTARLVGVLERTLPASPPAAAAQCTPPSSLVAVADEKQSMQLSASSLARNCALLLCGVRPSWLAGQSPWMEAVDGWAAAACSNRYYSCC